MTSEKKKSKTVLSATGIIRLAGDALTLFHTPGREPFASLKVRDHWENHRIKSQGFQDCLSAICYHWHGAVPNHKAIAEASSTLAGRALYASSEKQIYVRLAGHDGAIYVDLANESWEAVRITGEGWKIVSHTPVKFIRAPGMQALPRPVGGGTIDDLRPFLNFVDEDHWKLAVSWLIGTLRPDSQYPPLVLEGTHGCAKSTAAKLLRSLIDPNTAPLRGDPRSGRDLAISARNSWYLGFDNLSSVRPWLSDALCRLSTGGGFSTRMLYTDDDEKVFDGTRPILLNGIDLGIERADLLDRAIILSLSPISEEGRQTEADLWARFEAVRPSILGCLLDAVSCAMRRLSETKLSKLPRMADFATWVCAAEPALGWPEGSFVEAYRRNLAEANALALEASPLVKPLMRIVDRGPWRGTATQLLSDLQADFLTVAVDEEWSGSKSPRELSQEIHRLMPGLQKVGIIIDFRRTPGDNSERIISMCKSGDGATQPTTQECVQE